MLQMVPELSLHDFSSFPLLDQHSPYLYIAPLAGAGESGKSTFVKQMK